MTDWSEIKAIRRAAAAAVPPPPYVVDEPPPSLDDEGTRRLQAVLKVPSPPAGWPVLREDHALVGLAGDVVRTIEPHSESDPVALLLDFLASFGNAVGRGPHMFADSARHTARLNIVLVGETSRARKGSSRANVRRIMEAADEDWAESCNGSGLASGEGLIANLAEREDRRLYVTEPEFARVLKVANREGNILSPLIRQAWDGDRLQNMTKKDPLKVDLSHVSLLAHITVEELHRALTETEAANGFGNRFIWACVRRSKKLPDGGNLTDQDVAALGQKIRSALQAAREVGRLQRSREAAELWATMYEQIRDETGMVGAMTARAEAQLLRLSITYALLDGTKMIEPQHLLAAASIWGYGHRSVEFLFGGRSGDPVKDTLLEAIQDAGSNGLTFTEQRNLFSRHQSHRVRQARKELEADGKTETIMEQTGGRPRKISYAIG